MSGYGKMQASPFWRRVMGVTALIAVITLITPAIYCLKYALIDRPIELRAAGKAARDPQTALANAQVAYIDFYIARSRQGSGAQRIAALNALSDMVLLPDAQVKYPIECLDAKLAIEKALESDPDKSVHAAAMACLLKVAAHGAVIKR